MPPTLFLVLATPFWKLAHTVFFYNWYAAVAVYSGGIFGYICYDCTHYFLHHKRYVKRTVLDYFIHTDKHHSLPAYWHALKKYHLQHHFADYENGFGVTSRFWDRVFGTELPPPPQAKVLKST
jgi:4-hydroxysphinganine ceramide fatty acyl 2-hydroxylase